MNNNTLNWKNLVRRASQAVAAGALMLGGIIFTIGHQKDMSLGKPGELFKLPTTPATIVEAVRPSDQQFKISQVLRKYTKSSERADRIASALVAEGKKNDVDPVLLVGVLLTENAKLDPSARSSVGAKGLMQVMPFHSGQWGCATKDLTSIEGNICHGVRILANYMGSSKSMSKALLRYNGCVKGRNTPNCHTYPRKVYAYAEQAEKSMSAIKLP